MRLFVSVLATVAMFFAASTAGAVEFSVVGDNFATVLPGDSVTINIVMTNTSATPVNGLGASVSDYGPNTFDNGRAVASYLNSVCVPGVGCFGGLTNLAAPNLAESAIGANGDRIQIALSAALTPSVGAGIDEGLDGTPAGSAMFQVTFIAVDDALINIGTSYQGDGVILADGSTIQAQGATFQLNVIPEPGTALLMGLGLAGLAAAGRRE